MIALLALLAAVPADPFAGTWEGASMCQVRPSPCRDEHVIYRVAATGKGRYRVQAYKLVAGEKQFMGPLDLNRDKDRLTGSNTDRAGVIHPWIFVLKGDHLSGRALTSAHGQVYRLIEVDRR